MIFTECELAGTFIIDLQRIEDARGFFARAWCKRELEAHGLSSRVLQANIGFSKLCGTLRGLHYQVAPHTEVKIVRCTAGAVYDVVVDLRPHSPTHRRWLGVELSAQNGRMLYVPEGCAHGYQTLEDNTEVLYQASELYAPESARGVRHDDPAFRITWPLHVVVISDADRSWPSYSAEAFPFAVGAQERPS